LATVAQDRPSWRATALARAQPRLERVLPMGACCRLHHPAARPGCGFLHPLPSLLLVQFSCSTLFYRVCVLRACYEPGRPCCEPTLDRGKAHNTFSKKPCVGQVHYPIRTSARGGCRAGACGVAKVAPGRGYRPCG